MGGSFSLTDVGQADAEETTAATYTDAVDRERSGRVDVCVDTSGAATLTVEFSTTGEFTGEEWSTTVDYSAAVEQIEQFSPAHRYVRAKVDANLNRLQVVKGGI